MCKKLLVFLFCLGLASVANAELIAHYQFEGDFSDTTGTQPDGIAIGSPEIVVDAERGNVLSVSGGNQVDAGVVTNASVTDMTVGFWVKSGPIGVSNRPMTSASADYTTDPGWMVMMRNDDWGTNVPPNVWFRINGEPAVDPIWNGGDLWLNESWTHNEWSHLAFTFDATSRIIKGYVNGIEAGEKLVTEATRAVGSDVEHMILGGQAEAFTGLLDDVFIANHAMNEAEIQTISGVPEPGTLVLLISGGLGLLLWRRRRS